MSQSLETSLPFDLLSTTVEDIDSLHGIVADGIEVEFVRLRRAVFYDRWAIVQLPSLVVQYGRAANPLIHRARTHGDRWLFIVPMAVCSGGRSNGRSIGEADVVVCPPGTESRGLSPRGTEFALISMDGLTAAPIVAMMPHGRASSDIVRTGRKEAAALRQLLERVRVEFGPRQSLRRVPVRYDLAQGLCNAVIGQLCTAGGAAHLLATVRSRLGMVCQAEDFVRHHGGEKVTVSRLSTVVGMSERSLRNAFHDVYGTGPKRYLRTWQLHRVRHALRSVVDTGRTVTEVATLHGFFELGRFAGDYKALFGEGPAQTLHQARKRIGQLEAITARFGPRAVTTRRRLVA